MKNTGLEGWRTVLDIRHSDKLKKVLEIAYMLEEKRYSSWKGAQTIDARKEQEKAKRDMPKFKLLVDEPGHSEGAFEIPVDAIDVMFFFEFIKDEIEKQKREDTEKELLRLEEKRKKLMTELNKKEDPIENIESKTINKKNKWYKYFKL